MMTMRELAALPQLRLRVLTGADELDRPIRWVHPTDMLDPSAYLGSGELVLTNGLWRSSPEDSETFVAHLIRAGVHGLVFAVYPDQSTPADLVTACDVGGLPLLELHDLPFRAISEAVIDRMVGDREVEQLHLREYETAMTRAVADGEGVNGICRLFHQKTGVACIVFARDGTPAGQVDWPGVDYWGMWVAAAHAGRGGAAASRGVRLGLDTLFVVRPGGLGRGGIADAYLVVAQRRELLDAGQRAAIVIATEHLRLEFSRLRSIRITERRFARELIERARSDAVSDGELAAIVPTLGLDDTKPIVVLEATTDTKRIDEGLLLVEAALGRARSLCVLGGVVVIASGPVVGAVPTVTDGQDIHHHLRSLITGVAECLDMPGVAVGVSEVASSGLQIRQALAQAHQAREIASGRTERPAIISRHDIGSYALLLAVTDPAARATHRTTVLGPLIDYDTQRNAQLVRTLEQFLRNCGALERTARGLGIHVNTLRYRLNQIEQLTDRPLSTMPSRVDFFLALECTVSDETAAGTSRDHAID